MTLPYSPTSTPPERLVRAPSAAELTHAASVVAANLAPTPLVDAACRLWRLERAVRLDALAARGLRVVPWDADEPLEIALARVPARQRSRRTA